MAVLSCPRCGTITEIRGEIRNGPRICECGGEFEEIDDPMAHAETRPLMEIA